MRLPAATLVRLIAAALLCLAALPLDAGAQRLQYAERMIELIGEGDVEAYARFRLEAFADTDTPESEWRDVFVQLHDAFGRLRVDDVSATPQQARLVASPERMPEAVVVFEFRFERAPPYRILEVGVAVEEADAAARAESLGIGIPPIRPDMGADDLRSALGGYLAELEERDVLSGVVAVTRDGGVEYEAAFGDASKSYGVANTTATALRVGSITKVFVRVAAARLFLEAKLAPDSTVASVLPDYPAPESARRITARHLLDHRSGLAELRFDDFVRLSNRTFRRPEDYFPLFANDPLRFAPGTEREYSNAGYIVLGAMIEAVTGEPYERVLERLVFEPSAMSASGFWALDRPHPGLATGYWKCEGPDGPWCSNDNFIEIEGTPSGGSYSTAADLLAFQASLSAGELLPPEWTHWVYTGEWPGAGMVVDQRSWRPAWAGGAEGTSAIVAARGEWAVIVLSNYDEPAGELVGTAILGALAGER